MNCCSITLLFICSFSEAYSIILRISIDQQQLDLLPYWKLLSQRIILLPTDRIHDHDKWPVCHSFEQHSGYLRIYLPLHSSPDNKQQRSMVVWWWEWWEPSVSNDGISYSDVQLHTGGHDLRCKYNWIVLSHCSWWSTDHFLRIVSRTTAERDR